MHDEQLKLCKITKNSDGHTVTITVYQLILVHSDGHGPLKHYKIIFVVINTYLYWDTLDGANNRASNTAQVTTEPPNTIYDNNEP